ncbi:response regulator transcription factor [Pseudoflavonifractor sp. An184]|uniref:winged helix-turn-helix domain-containing protein n=1 Tax=Pseudoflavonifractor sp. An184 TaxID=1965576 RepID=UPI000B379DBA|nr:response regulator transcription factor [Pseudoflavonifractor sp. An184]OUP59156.1 transcriptional regulator [Pseudoflavonifractor sp. An184]
MAEIIVIYAQDPDGSVFQAVMDALKGKRAEVVDVSNLSASVLHIGDLEIHHEQRRVLMAGREVELNHGEYAMLYCMASSPGQLFSKAQLYEAAWGEEYLHGTNSVENIIWRLRRKLEEDPKHPGYIKTVVGMDYKIDIDGEEQEIKNGI